MGKLIDADALIEKCGGWYTEEGTEEGFIGTIKQLLEAQPEAVVRCRDCKNYEFACNRVPEEQTWYCYMWDCETGCEDFCSYGERRTDETN